jgi:hypothetical protein
VHDFLVRAHRPNDPEAALVLEGVDLRDGAARPGEALQREADAPHQPCRIDAQGDTVEFRASKTRPHPYVDDVTRATVDTLDTGPTARVAATGQPQRAEQEQPVALGHKRRRIEHLCL